MQLIDRLQKHSYQARRRTLFPRRTSFTALSTADSISFESRALAFAQTLSKASQSCFSSQEKCGVALGAPDLRIDRKAIMNGIKDWKRPLHFLDFETFGPAIPRYEGVGPYQQVSFQFSCHIQDAPGAQSRHVEYLHNEPTDPRPAVAAALSVAIGEKGSIVAYNKSVEARAVAQLAETCWINRFRKKSSLIKYYLGVFD